MVKKRALAITASELASLELLLNNSVDLTITFPRFTTVWTCSTCPKPLIDTSSTKQSITTLTLFRLLNNVQADLAIEDGRQRLIIIFLLHS